MWLGGWQKGIKSSLEVDDIFMGLQLFLTNICKFSVRPTKIPQNIGDKTAEKDKSQFLLSSQYEEDVVCVLVTTDLTGCWLSECFVIK